MTTTVRELIDELTTAAANWNAGLDTPIEFGVCYGQNVQLLDRVDVDIHTRLTEHGSPVSEFVLFRGHHHPGEQAGELLTGIAGELEADLRRLADEDDGF